MSDENKSNLGNPVQLLSGMGETEPAGTTWLFDDDGGDTEGVEDNPPPANESAPRQFASPASTPFSVRAPIPALKLLPGMKSATVQDVTGEKTTLPLVKGAGGEGVLAKAMAWARANPAVAVGGLAAIWYFFIRPRSGGGLGDLGTLGGVGGPPRRGKRVGGLGCVCD